MAKRKKSKKQAEETLVDLVEARNNAQDFLDTNQNLIFGILAGVVVLIGGFLAYQNFVVAPKEKAAVAAMWKAENQFFQDSFALALTNQAGGYDGLQVLTEEYSGVPSGSAANYYAGISYLNLGQYEAAISYLKDVKASGEVMPIMKNGAIGDCYSEMENYDQAKSYYKKAINAGENEAVTPVYLLRYGMLCEKLGETSEAIKTYESIVADYPTASQTRDAKKFLVRLNG